MTTLLHAQDTQPPVAPPADPNSTPPIAQPVTLASPPAPEPAQPPATPTPVTGTNALVITTPAASTFETAMVAYNTGHYADAVIGFSDFVRDFRQDRRREEAVYRLAESYRLLGRADDALAAYAYQIQNYPDGPLRPSADLRRGAVLYDAGKYGEAIPPLQRVAKNGNADLAEAAQYLLGRSFLATQKEPDARALLQPLADGTGKTAGPAAQALAELDDSQANYPDATTLWQKALAAATGNSTRAPIAARGGWSALQSNQPAIAEKLFQVTRQIDPTGDSRRVANTGLLRLLYQQKRDTEWLAVYLTEKDKLLDSAKAEVSYALGHVHFTLKHWPEAVAAFDSYLHDFGTQENAVTVAYERFLALAQIDPSRTVVEGDAYLKAWPQSPYVARVQLLEAQQLSREKKFADALPLWQGLAVLPASADLPRLDILLELARAEDELKDWPKAAIAYQAYLDELSTHGKGKAIERKRLATQARLAVCLQNANQLNAATDAWKVVQSEAPAGSPEQQMALESLGLIYARGGPPQEAGAVAAFRSLLDQYPQTKIRALAAFTVGDSSFRSHDYAGAEAYLLLARKEDPATWSQPATQRLVLGAYGMKNSAKALAYLQDYDAMPPPADGPAQVAARLPAALFYWLAETTRQSGALERAETFYARVTAHPEPGDLLAGAWWQLGEVQAKRHEWPAAVASYQKYRQLKPDAQNATVVLLALGRAQLGAGNAAAAQTLGQQALLQEPEGPNSAAARLLLGEAAFASQDYVQAEKMFVPLALLFDDPAITPQAMSRAADSFDKAGDPKSAADWRAKLAAKYPQYQPVAYP